MSEEFDIQDSDLDLYNLFVQLIKHLGQKQSIFTQQEKKEPVIFDCDIDVFYEFIAIINGIVSDVMRFKLIHKYCAVHQLKSNNVSVKMLNSCIDYTKMSLLDFLDGPGYSNILTNQEKYVILAKISLRLYAENLKLRKLNEKKECQVQDQKMASEEIENKGED